MGIPACSTGGPSAVAGTHDTSPLGDYSCPKESQSDFKTNTVERLNWNHSALSKKAKQFSTPLTTVSNTGTGNKMVELCSPSAASSLPPAPRNKADFQAKKKATKYKKTKASGEAQTLYSH